ncbi:hypothetical protein [Jiulongibacter sp. NS-SX5]|uniref:hypothetical protein n=1 Tax=Jiulongibacter sp. NS-SX5 TaxID=3463854 RepID=UPI00405A3F82
MNKATYTLLMLLLPLLAISQEASPSTRRSLAAFLKEGSFSGKARAYFMNSNNQSPLSDYHGLGIGGGLGYQTPTYKGFSAGMSGYFIVNAYSSDFTEIDSITQNPNRYELGLFDVTDPNNTSNLYRLENLLVQYSGGDFTLKYGQFKPDYFFINPQDGRMSPTMVRGFDGRFNRNNANIQLSYLHQVSPRSTVKWYSVEETFGIYPTGRATDGKASNYYGNISSNGILLLEVNQKIGNLLNTKFGLMNVNKVFSTYYTQIELKGAKGWSFATQGIYQHASHDGLNQSYIDSDHQSTVLSTRLAKNSSMGEFDFNYTRVFDQGRFLMPREWGREPLYTFLPRERKEGTANVHAITANYHFSPNTETTLHAGIGNYWLPDPSDAFRNKYAMPSYAQLNVDATYKWKNWLEGGSVKLLYVFKKGREDDFENLKYVFNKVNISLINLIFNYTF